MRPPFGPINMRPPGRKRDHGITRWTRVAEICLLLLLTFVGLTGSQGGMYQLMDIALALLSFCIQEAKCFEMYYRQRGSK